MRKFIPVLILSIFLASCHFMHHRIRGNGTIKTENRNSGSFDAIDVSGNYEVRIKQDSSRSVRVEADENLMEYIQIKTEGSTLVINTKDDANLSGSKDLVIYVSAPVFRDLEATGACNIISENQINSTDKISIHLTGASDVDMDIKSPSITSTLSGAGTVKLKGQTKDFSVDGSGSVSVKCMDLLAENVDVDISGAGSALVFASVKLHVSVSGAGDVKYKGNAAVTKQISGAGSVEKVD